MSFADILIVDDEPDLRELYQLALVREGYSCECASSLADAKDAMRSMEFRLAIVDMRLGDGTGMDLMFWMQTNSRRERVVIATAYGSADNAVEALKAGAFDYLSKPIDLKQLRLVVRSALGEAGTEVAKATVVQTPIDAAEDSGALARLVGRSEQMQKLREMVRKVAASMAPVLVAGESGTGKELIARAIHDCSARASGPFVPVNCGAIPADLLEAEFFGYRKGAFTGASADREGFFQAAAGGTLFLDEVAELPLSMQAKLLRALQERRVRRLGDTAELAVDVRILSATHQDLRARVAAGAFRQDLYYRLNVIDIQVPPLRARSGDLEVLAGYVLQRLSAENARRFSLAPSALQALERYSFPGNVRELENILQRACALANQELLEASDLAFELTEEQEIELAGVITPAAGNADFLPSNIGMYIDSVEREFVERALERTGFNRTEAAALLGLNLRQMRYRMQRLGIKDED